MLKPDRKQLVGLLTQDPKVVLEEGAQIVDDPGQPLPMKMIGHVTSSYWSEALGRSIALAIVEGGRAREGQRSEEHTSELQSLMRLSYAVFCLKKKND